MNALAQVAAAFVLLESVRAGHEAHRATATHILRFGTLADVTTPLVLLKTVWTEHRTHGSQATLVPRGSLRFYALTDVASVQPLLESIRTKHSTDRFIGAWIDMVDSGTLAHVAPIVILCKSRLAAQRASDGRTFLFLLEVHFFVVAVFAFACLATKSVLLEAERAELQAGDWLARGRKALAEVAAMLVLSEPEWTFDVASFGGTTRGVWIWFALA